MDRDDVKSDFYTNSHYTRDMDLLSVLLVLLMVIICGMVFLIMSATFMVAVF